MKKPVILIEEEGVKKLSIPEEYKSHISTFAYLYLQPNGWFSEYPCDDTGVMPWLTFPSVSFLKDIVTKDMKVLEYGGGYSTIFFNNITQHTVTIEHDEYWYNVIKQKNPNIEIHLVPNYREHHVDSVETVKNFFETFPQIRSEDKDHDLKHGMVNDEFIGYASMIYNYPKGYFDVILLDGMARELTGVLALERINENGIIILDNSDRWQYNSLQRYFINNGYKRIDFWGPGFGNHKAWCTSIFAKNLSFNNNNVERPRNDGDLFV